MRMYILHLGDVEVDRGAMFTPGRGDGEMIRIPVPAYLLETDAGERILVDTGMHEAHIDDPDHTFGPDPQLSRTIRPRMRDEHRIEHQLGLLGLTTQDVTLVVNTHLHFDHCGQNHRFPSAPILVQKRTITSVAADDVARRYFDLPQLTYHLLNGDGEIADGVTAIIAPGHAPDLMCLLVRLDHGSVLLCGDAIPTAEVLRADLWSGFDDPEAAAESGHRLATLAAAHDAHMLFGHDIAQWTELPHAPLAYGCTR